MLRCRCKNAGNKAAEHRSEFGETAVSDKIFRYSLRGMTSSASRSR